MSIYGTAAVIIFSWSSSHHTVHHAVITKEARSRSKASERETADAETETKTVTMTTEQSNVDCDTVDLLLLP